MATNTMEMQNLLARYADSLPQTSASTGEASSARGPKTVAIIGSTGFLGPYIVASLLKVHPESKIICLNRSADGMQRTISALHQAMDSDTSLDLSRLQFHVTDITRLEFGLDAEVNAILASEVDELIFNAWDTNWAKPLAPFEPFLRALRHAVDFCASASKRPRITFVSSICAVGDWAFAHPEQPLVPEEVLWDDHSVMKHGYGQSKRIAEQLLTKANEASGLRVNIVRAGQIGGPSHMSHVKAWPVAGWIYSIIRGSKKIGWFPAHVEPLDWIPVDALAEGIANSTKRYPTPDVEVFNMVHPHPAPWNILYETVHHRFGLDVKTTSLPDWLRRMGAAKFRLYGFLSTFGDGREDNLAFCNDRALEVLPVVPSIDEQQLGEWMDGWGMKLNVVESKL
jgi:thioester reductase-like protein